MIEASDNPTAKAAVWLTEGGLALARGWARNGLTEAEIAGRMGCRPAALAGWKAKHPELAAALALGREACDLLVEEALYQSARGGSVTAQIYWLKNRRRAEWRDKPEADQAAADGALPEILAFLNGES